MSESGYIVATEQHGTGSLNFKNEFAKDVIIVGSDNSSSSHADNCKNNFFVLGADPTFGINGSFGSAEKKLSINFSRATQHFAWVCIIILIIVICFLMEKKF